MRRAARIASAALIAAGLVVLLDVGITLAWSEPVSTLRGWLAQRDAAEELERLEERFGARRTITVDGEIDPGRVLRYADQLEARVREGQAIGRVKIPAIDLNAVMVHGTDTASLQNGPGHYPEKAFPGQPGTVAIAGHRTTYLAPFRRINEIGRGDEVVIEMPYATFRYRFEKQRIVDPSQVGVVRDVGHDRVVLTACHPLYSAAQRIVVFARLVDVDPPGGDEERETTGGAPAGEEIDEAGLGSTLGFAGGLVAIGGLMWLGSGPRRAGESSTGRGSGIARATRGERAFGIVAGLLLGLVIVAVFVFEFSGETVDPPSLAAPEAEATRVPAGSDAR